MLDAGSGPSLEFVGGQGRGWGGRGRGMSLLKLGLMRRE